VNSSLIALSFYPVADLVKQAGSGRPATMMVVFVFCIVGSTRGAYPDADPQGTKPQVRNGAAGAG
jgi:hypothetical protein